MRSRRVSRDDRSEIEIEFEYDGLTFTCHLPYNGLAPSEKAIKDCMQRAVLSYQQRKAAEHACKNLVGKTFEL